VSVRDEEVMLKLMGVHFIFHLYIKADLNFDIKYIYYYQGVV
jgi:hypothetical protein